MWGGVVIDYLHWQLSRLATSDCSHACIFFGKEAEFKRSKLVNRLEYMVTLLGGSVTHSQTCCGT